NRRTSASSSSSRELGSRSSRTAAVRASGNGDPARASPAAWASGPLMRMTEMAAGGRPLDKAKMVSVIDASGEDWGDHRRDVPGALVNHLYGDPQDHQQPYPCDPAVAFDVAGDEVGGDAHQQHGQDEAEYEHVGVLPGGASHRQHIVQAHADIGERNAPSRAGEALGRLQSRMLVACNLIRSRALILVP